MNGNDAVDWAKVLIQRGVLSDEQLSDVLSLVETAGISVEESLKKWRYANNEEICSAKAAHYGYAYWNLEAVEIDPSVIGLVPQDIVDSHMIIPLGNDDKNIRIAFSNDSLTDIEGDFRQKVECLVLKLESALHIGVTPVYGTESLVFEAIRHHYDEPPMRNSSCLYIVGGHHFTTTGTLEVETAAWGTIGGCSRHADGVVEIRPADDDYQFWCWLVRQPFQSNIWDTELAAIRKRWKWS